MKVFTLDPLQDPRWNDFVAVHPHASVFHTVGWLAALKRSYGFKPVVFTTSAPGEVLQTGVPFCEVNSWLTGRRLVSLPFSDHCQPLLRDRRELLTILDHVQGAFGRGRCKYIEVRPLVTEAIDRMTGSFARSESFRFHTIDLRPDTQAIYSGFHDSCVRRKIRKAEREAIVYEAGRSMTLLEKFYGLFVITRRRHNLPPQPIEWFENLMDCLGDALTIRVASQGSQPVASIITLQHRKSIIYKYGCSDLQYSNLGGTPLLFWKTIQEGKEQGAEELDLGRSDAREPGLSTFKEHLGGSGVDLHYYRHGQQQNHAPRATDRSFLREAVARMPNPIFSGVGRLLYRHMG